MIFRRPSMGIFQRPTDQSKHLTNERTNARKIISSYQTIDDDISTLKRLPVPLSTCRASAVIVPIRTERRWTLMDNVDLRAQISIVRTNFSRVRNDLRRCSIVLSTVPTRIRADRSDASIEIFSVR